MPDVVTIPARSRTTYLLGAGFSRAVSSHMPITDELGRRVVRRLGWQDEQDIPTFQAGKITFETWMTWLAERQPFLSEAQSLNDRARFARLTETIASELRDSQLRASNDGTPDWLAQLVDLAHWQRSSLVTLNYDTIVETEISAYTRWERRGWIRPEDVVAGTPNEIGVFMAEATTFRNRDTLRLFKLHGSVDWFAVPGDVSGATLKRIANPEDDSYAGRAAIGGREVFIVPPTSTKGTYFDNPKTRFVWQQARDALAEAERIVLLGYSLPLTDTALARLLATTVTSGTQTVVIVDPNARDVRNNLAAVGVDAARISMVEGWDCVPEFVAAELESVSNEVAARFATETADAQPVAVGWENHGWAPVSSVSLTDDGTLRLTLDYHGPLASILHPLATPGEVSDARPTATMSDLRSVGTFRRVTAQVGDQDWPIVGWVAPSDEHADDWVLLRPASRPPAL